MPENRRNLQVRQGETQGYESIDKNGWPVPLSDPTDPLKLKVTTGSNGEQKNIRAMSTSRQNELSLTEGKPPKADSEAKQGGHGNKLHTSQQNADRHHDPAGGNY